MFPWTDDDRIPIVMAGTLSETPIVRIRRFVGDLRALLRIFGKTISRTKLDVHFNLPVVCSVTTNGSRPFSLVLAINSVWLQKSVPELIFVSCPEAKVDRIARLLKRFCLGNYQLVGLSRDRGPAEKYLCARSHYADRIIVTFDDDVTYDANWLTELWHCHVKHPFALCGHRGVVLSWNSHYSTARRVDALEEFVSNDLLLTGHGGILYPPGVLRATVDDVEKMMQLCPGNDDIWINLVATEDDVPRILCRSTRREPAAHPWVQRKALWKKNVRGGRNAIYWQACGRYLELS